MVIPAHNAQKTIARALQSLLDQNFGGFEVLVVDDGSTDATALIAEAFAESDTRVRVLPQQQGGVSSARNAGLAAAQGSHLTFLDADDWVEPSHLERMVATAELTMATVVQTGYVVETPDASGRTSVSEIRSQGCWSVGLGQAPAVEIHDELINSIGYVWNKLYELEPLRQKGHAFDTKLSIYEDLIFNAELLGSGASIATVPDATVHYVQSPGESLGKAAGAGPLNARWAALQALWGVLTVWDVPPDVMRQLRTRQALQALRSDLVRESRQLAGVRSVLRRGREKRRSSGHAGLVGVVLREGSWPQRAAVLLLTLGRPLILVALRVRSTSLTGRLPRQPRIRKALRR